MASNNHSLKDIGKTLSSTLSSSQASANLPPQLEQIIQTCVDKEPTVDEVTATRLQDDLLYIYRKSVQGVETKLGAFLQALVLLEPCIKGQSRKQEWWKLVVKPVLDSFGRRRVEIERATEFISRVLNYDADEDTDGADAKQAAHFTTLVLDAYLARTTIEDIETHEYSLEDEHIASQFEKVLIDFGKTKPQDLLIALDNLVIQTKHRQQGLGLLSTFVRNQPPHLDLVSKTPLIEHLLQCLMIDTSSTVVQVALTVLIMFLPNIPTFIRSHLPRLFLVYSRLLCWEQAEKPHREANSSNEEQIPESESSPATPQGEDGSSWDKLEGYPGEDVIPLDVSYYFTFLYGLYPMNLISYIKKPRRYLKNINFPRADQLDLEQDLIRVRTEPLRGMHALHPNFYSTTAEDELEDNRWLTLDAADVVADCISLRMEMLSSSQPPGPPPTSKLPDPPVEATATGAEDEKTASGINGASPSSRAKSAKQPPRRPSRPPTGLDPGDSPTLPPAALTSRRESTTTTSTTSTDPSKALLQQQLVILRNDLNFERYLKQQHLAHIGQLQRRHIADATIAAHTENLTNMNKSLKAKLAKANDAYANLKKETATGRSQSKRFESELSSRVRNLRDAERAWQTEESTLKLELEKARADCENLRKIVVEAEARELLALQKIGPLELKLEQTDALSGKVQDLEEQLRVFDSKDLEYERTASNVEILRLDLQTANLQLQSKDSELERLRKSYDRRIADLESQLAEKSRAATLDADGLSPERRARVQAVIERALNEANGRTETIRKKHASLRHSYAELELRCQELEGELENLTLAAQGKSVPQNIPAPKRAGTMPLMGASAHWRNSTGTPTDTDEGSASSPGRGSRIETLPGPTLRRTSREAASALAAAAATSADSSAASPVPTAPVVGPASAPAKQMPMPVGTALGSPKASVFPANEPSSLPEGDSNVGGGGSSAPAGGAQGFYMNKRSAWSVDSFDSGQTGESGKTKGSMKSGRSAGGTLFGKRTEGEAEEERRRREAKRRQPPKQGGLRGLRGLI